MRLDKYLITKYPNLSRAYIKDQVKLGNFLVYPVKSGEAGAKQFNRVNGKKVKPSYMLSEGDQVVFAPGFALPEKAAILPNPDIKLNIIFENEDVVVIDKPAGLSVHPRQDKNGLPLLSEINSTLISGLLSYYPPLASVGDILAIRPGIVHRLDKDTSGVMIVAKNQNSFDWLKKQFKDRQATKKYLALVHGQLKEKQGKIKTLLQRASSDPTRQKVSIGEGKESLTLYRVIKEFKNYSLLEASPKTGRLHQIRVHLAHLGHSVAGDAKYGDKRLPVLPDLRRQFLHATELEITLPDSQKRIFSSPLPPDLMTVIAALEKISH